MKLDRTSAVVDFQLLAQFQRLRDTLLEERFAPHWDRPLAYWALPNDRRLPLAFMDRSIRNLLETPFDELHSTPGVGQKKIRSMVELLGRAVDDEPSNGHAPVQPEPVVKQPAPVSNNFDPSNVSESTWAEWRESIKRNELEGAPLGRFARSLLDLPKVLWQTDLGTYTELTLGEIRRLKTHGEKRVHVLLEIFHDLHRVVSMIGPQTELTVSIRPRFASQLESWIASALIAEEPPSAEELHENFIQPLVAQTRIDAGESLAELVELRLGLGHEVHSVREVAEKLGLTRARVYQMMADLAAVMQVRWPEGQSLVHELVMWLHATKPEGEYRSFFAGAEVFFPAKRSLHEDSLNEDDGSDLPYHDPGHRRAG